VTAAEPAHPESDGSIVEAVLSGEKDRFGLIVERYQAALWRAARSRLGRADWADDAVQEAFLCAFKSLASYNSAYSFRTWLWTILLNQCRRMYQKQARVPQVRPWSDQPPEAPSAGQLALTLESGDASPPGRLLAKERTEQLEMLLARLPEVQADALRLRFFGELSFIEIADAMACSLSSAKNRVRCGLIQLSRLIEESRSMPPGSPSAPASTAENFYEL
jgi:RNA polymerase sigma-70 factor, ECF subfamily